MKKNTLNTLGLLSFAALILFAVSALLSQVGANMGFFRWVGEGLLLFTVLCLAYFYVRKLSKTWLIVYVVIAVLAVLSFLWEVGLF
ncbi:MAG: hypothetical protein ACOX5N_00690 [Bacilli bacterium]|jgi:hypothetical protein|nr:hypothetical protein [Bacilli bacterium]